MQIVRWNGVKRLSNFKPAGSHCNDLRGNDGSKFRSGVRESDVLFLFLVSDFCSGIPFTFDSYSSVGLIQTMRFKFKFNDTTSMDCLSSMGVIDVSACHSEAPIFLSGPHFFQGSDFLKQGILGLEPNQSLHESFIDVEPVTGILLRIAMRLQVNVRVLKDVVFPMTWRLPFEEKIIPILWMEHSAVASPDAISRLDQQIFSKVRALKYLSWSLIVAGTVIILISFAAVSCDKMRQKRLAERLVGKELPADESAQSVNE